MYQQTLYGIVNPIDEEVINKRNKSKSWEYGYNSEHDVVVISKTGMIGEVYQIQNLKIALPKKPKKVFRFKENKWQAAEYPKELNRIKSIFDWLGSFDPFCKAYMMIGLKKRIFYLDCTFYFDG